MARIDRFHRYPLRSAIVLLLAALLLVVPVTVRISHSSSPDGPSWEPVALRGVLVHSLALGHGSSRLAFAAAHGGIYRRSGKNQWSRVLNGGEVWDIQVLPDNRTVIAAEQGARGGLVAVSTDAGSRWRRHPVSQFGVYAVTAVPGDPRQLLAGADGGIFWSNDGGLHWRRQLALPQSGIATFAWQPGGHHVLFAGAVAGMPGGSTQVFRSQDAGNSWQAYGKQLNSTGGIMSLAAPRNNELFAGTMGNAIWHISNVEQIWRKHARNMPQTNDHVAGIITMPEQPQTLVVGTLGHGIYVTADSGNHWHSLSTGLSPSGMTVLSLAAAAHHHVLYAATADGLYELDLGRTSLVQRARSG